MHRNNYKSLAAILGALCVSHFAAVALSSETKQNSLYDNIFSAITDLGDSQAPVNRVERQLGNQPRSGRQVDPNGPNPVVPGFPSGLTNQVPKGVRLALASVRTGPDGEMIMNPIPGEAGVDYPVFNDVPETNFECTQQNFLPGIYGDPGAQCQVFHMCEANGNVNSFLCPNGTMFNQQYFICDWWYNVDCGATTNFYALNEFIYEENPNDNDL